MPEPNEPGGPGESVPGPNVLVVICDDLATLASGWPSLDLPNFNRLRARGTTYLSAYCQAPICGPSRASLLTGLHPTTTGIFDHSVKFRDACPDVVTIPQYFRQAGYLTAGNGKIFHPTAQDPDWLDSVSWDRYDCPFPSLKPAPAGVLNGFNSTWDWGAALGVYGDDQIAAACEAFLAENHGSPFFLAAGLTAAHVPWYVPWPVYNSLPLSSVVLPQVMPGDLADVPGPGQHLASATGMSHAAVLAEGKWKGAMRCYLAAVKHLDQNLGRILDALEASPYAGNTVIVLVSDHGMHLGQKDHWSKFTLWEEACRVPLIISTPGQAGREVSAPVGLVDLFPTLLELCGLPGPGGLEGISLAGPVPLEREISTNYAGHVATTSRYFREIVYTNGDRERYRRDSDPSEWLNLG